MVPEEPTVGMLTNGVKTAMGDAGCGATYRAMLAAAPAYEPTEADVERMARAIWEDRESNFQARLRQVWDADGPLQELKREHCRNMARAAIRAFLEGK